MYFLRRAYNRPTIHYWFTWFVFILPLSCQLQSIYDAGDLSGTTLVLQPANIIANNKDQAEVSIYVRTRQGVPSVNLFVQVKAGPCQVQNPEQPTDAAGFVKAKIQCNVTGNFPITLVSGRENYQIPIEATTTLTVYPDANRGGFAVAAGQPLSAQAVIADATGAPNLNYRGRVAIRSSDPNALLPPAHTFTENDLGVKLWLNAITLRTAGQHTIVIYDVDTGTVYQEQVYEVLPGILAQFAFEQCNKTWVAGDTFACQTIAQDQFRNTITSYLGKINITSNDALATMPQAYTYTEQDQGSASLAGFVLRKSGWPEVIVEDGSIRTVLTPFQIQPAAPIRLQILPENNATIGIPQGLTVQALDTFDNPSPYNGNIIWSLSDPNADVSPYLVDLETTGTSRHDIFWRKSGLQTIAMLDTSQQLPNVTTQILVAPGIPERLELKLSAIVIPYNQPAMLQASILDQYGNTCLGNNQQLILSTTDPNSFFQPSWNVGNNTPVSLSIPIAFRTLGQHTITLQDAAQQLIATSVTIVIGPGQSSACSIDIVSPIIEVGDIIDLNLSMMDDRGSLDTNYIGTMALSFALADPTLPGNAMHSFDALDRGQHSFFSLNFTKAGLQTITARDVAKPNITCNLTIQINNKPAVGLLQLVSQTNVTAGQLFQLEILGVDLFGNQDPNFLGTVALTTTYPNDANFILPNLITFDSAAAGKVTINNLQMLQIGNYTITATESTYNWTSTISIQVKESSAAWIELNFPPFPEPNQGIVGVPLSPTISIFDAFGNLCINYFGTIHFELLYYGEDSNQPIDPNNLPWPLATSFDPNGITKLIGTTPLNYTFSPLDQGIHQFDQELLIYVAGNYQLAVMDTQNQLPRIQSSLFSIRAAAPSKLSIKLLGTRYLPPLGLQESETYEGIALDANGREYRINDVEHTAVQDAYEEITIGIYDDYGNIVRSFVGDITITTNDPNAEVSNPFHLAAADQGEKLFTQHLQFKTIGNYFLTGEQTTFNLSTTLNNIRVNKIRQVTASTNNTVVLLGDHQIIGWGTNYLLRGPFGDDSYTRIPFSNGYRGCFATSLGANMTKPALGGFVPQTISSGMSYHWCASNSMAEMKCFGLNTYGQLGYEDITTRASFVQNPPLPIVGLGLLAEVDRIETAEHQSCALLLSGDIKCWGLNNTGNLGYGDTLPRGMSKYTMGTFLPPINVGTGRSVLDIQLGRQHTCVLLDNGDIKCWGANQYGQLGQGDTNYRGDNSGEMGDFLPPVALDPVHQSIQLASGHFHNCAILQNNTVKCWGANKVTYEMYYQLISRDVAILGIGDYENRGDDVGEMDSELPIVDLGNFPVADLVAGSTHTCAQNFNHQLKCWGDNRENQLGSKPENRKIDIGSDLLDMGDNLPFVELGPRRSVGQQFSLGMQYTCVVLDNGRLKCFGENTGCKASIGNASNPNELPFVRLW